MQKHLIIYPPPPSPTPPEMLQNLEPPNYSNPKIPGETTEPFPTRSEDKGERNYLPSFSLLSVGFVWWLPSLLPPPSLLTPRGGRRPQAFRGTASRPSWHLWRSRRLGPAAG